jgi:hypothetical protein
MDAYQAPRGAAHRTAHPLSGGISPKNKPVLNEG